MIELRIAAQDERSVGCSIDVGQGAADARPGFLFLDVDGVLHHYEAATRPEWFEPRCMWQLQRIVRATGCKIVLSSTWRTDAAMTLLLNAVLAKHGISHIVGKTPQHTARLAHSVIRAREISEWRQPRERRESPWVVLDDLPMQAEIPFNEGHPACFELQDNFVNTCPTHGLTSAHADAAIACLLGAATVDLDVLCPLCALSREQLEEAAPEQMAAAAAAAVEEEEEEEEEEEAPFSLVELSDDLLTVLGRELCDPLAPLLAVHLSSTSKGLRELLQAPLQELREQRQEGTPHRGSNRRASRRQHHTRCSRARPAPRCAFALQPRRSQRSCTRGRTRRAARGSAAPWERCARRSSCGGGSTSR